MESKYGIINSYYFNCMSLNGKKIRLTQSEFVFLHKWTELYLCICIHTRFIIFLKLEFIQKKKGFPRSSHSDTFSHSNHSHIKDLFSVIFINKLKLTKKRLELPSLVPQLHDFLQPIKVNLITCCSFFLLTGPVLTWSEIYA